jgi:hypothetical protein
MHFKTELKRDSAQKGAFQMGFKRILGQIYRPRVSTQDGRVREVVSFRFFRQLISVITAVTM